MKIIQFASGDLWAGAEVQLFYLSSELIKSKEIELLIVLLNDGQLADELRLRGINVVIFNESSLSGMSIFWKFYKLARDFKPDIIHTHRNKENVIGGMVALLTLTKSIRTVHGANEFAGQSCNLKCIIFNYLDRLAGQLLQKKIIAVSQELGGKLKTIFPSDKVVVIDNSINIEDVIEKSNEPTDHCLDENNFNVAFVGRFVPVKRVDLFYKIAKNVLELDLQKNIHFYMIGDGPLWQEMKDAINVAEHENRIHLTGFVKNVAPYLKHMNLLLFTSDHEGLPMTLLEAITLNVPVMSRELATIKQVLCSGECGYIVNSDNSMDFSDLIIQIRDNRYDSTHKLKMAAKTLEANYSIQNNVRRYISVYMAVI